MKKIRKMQKNNTSGFNAISLVSDRSGDRIKEYQKYQVCKTIDKKRFVKGFFTHTYPSEKMALFHAAVWLDTLETLMEIESTTSSGLDKLIKEIGKTHKIKEL